MRFARTGVAAAALASLASHALALGLGRLSVQSSLGEPLRAEIDITSLAPEEAGSLRVKVAGSEAYQAAGVEYNGVLPSTQAVLQRRPDGRPYLRLTSDRVVQEPFVDVILEVTWSSGKLVRDYTLLFDPPGLARAPAPSVSPSISPATAAAPAAPAAPAPSALPAAPAPAVPRAAATAPSVAPSPARTAAAAAAAPAPRSGADGSGADEYRVKSGDSLTRIATRTQRPGVSLDQMLVALFRGNPQAFVDNNMNRLRAGSVLSVPSAESAGGVSTTEARQIIQAQSADFGAYRQRLAGAVPAARTADASERQASGKVQAAVEDRKPASPQPDKLTLSKGTATPEAKASAPESRLSKERESRENATRVSELSKNVEELKQLSKAASAGAGSNAGPSPAPAASTPSAKAPAVTGTAAMAAASAPAVGPATTAPAALAAAPAAPPAPAAAARASETAAPAATVTAAASSPARPANASPAKGPVVAAGEEPGFLATLLDNPLVLPIAGVLVALLAGLGFYRLRSKVKPNTGETSFLESRLQPDSFFGASGGQRIDTRDAGGTPSSMSYSLSQLDAIGDVDPVAEADVYLAYGRDLQAEEILKEAMRANPDRMAVRTKLLEVYAKRRDIKGFELLATQLYALTRGEGEHWVKAQELGQTLDPENPMYQPGGHPELAVVDAEGQPVSEPLGASTQAQSFLPTPSTFEKTAVTPPSPGPTSVSGVDLDLDLDLSQSQETSPLPPSPPESTQPLDQTVSFDLPDLDLSSPQAPMAPAGPAEVAPDFNFSLEGMDFGDGKPSAAATATPAGPVSMPMGLDDGGDPLARKLELADEFRQIGDMEGARDLLNEVLSRADGALKNRAQAMLDDLA